jgi:hypothetical protein
MSEQGQAQRQDQGEQNPDSLESSVVASEEVRPEGGDAVRDARGTALALRGGRLRGRVLGFRTPDRVRERIRSGALVARLTRIALTPPDEDSKDVANSIAAAKALLAKVLPDLQSTQLSGDASAPLVILTRME